jgi:hypothetical protein
MLAVVVQRIEETRILDVRNSPVRAYRFTFMVGDHGPFTLDFSPNDVQTGAARLALNEFGRQIENAAS